MGFTFTIGGARAEIDKAYLPKLLVGLVVDKVISPHAPSFPGDEGQCSEDSFSYGGFFNFCDDAGLRGLFYGEDGRLKAGHPGCMAITEDDVVIVRTAREKWQAKATLPPGFHPFEHEGPDFFDYNLAWLMWFEFWMDWAVKNCETPAIQNC